MPKYKPFHISSFENQSGLDTYAESFLIPEKAFPTLEDAYAWRGRIKRRQGFELLGRLCRTISMQALANATGAGTYSVADVLSAVRATEPNAEIFPGSVTITISRGTANETIYRDNVTDGVLTHISGTWTGSGVINYISSTSAITITFTAAPPAGQAVDISYQYCPALPVMGLKTRESSVLINNEQLIAFDTKYAYQFTAGSFSELVAGTTWSGTDSDFFWTTNYYQNANGDIFWATNFSGPTGDPIRYYDGTAWTNFAPALDGGATTFFQQSLILLPYKDRLLAMNTYEGATLAGSTNFAQRIRFSQNGDPTDTTNGWRDDTVGRGGFIDIPTNEAIVSAEFIKDTLLVKCERSSWKVIYTGNETLPFVLQQINTELGAESTFSLVPFDRGVFAVGNYGITTDDSVNVARIDERIPDIVFSINNDNEGVERVYGIRNYQQQLVYWTFPNSAQNPTYPNKILVYNYVNKTYAIFNDSFTCFGYFQRGSDLTWATLGYPSWADWNDPWNSGLIQSQFPDIIGGNQQGYVETLNRQVVNDVSLSITAITPGTPPRLTVPNHNLQSGQFVKVTGIVGSGSPNPTTLNDAVYKIVRVDANNIDLADTVLLAGGTYLGGGKLTVVNNINILTKRFSPYYDQGAQVRLGYIDFFLEKTEDGEVTVNLYGDENSSISLNDPNSFSNDGLLGDNIVLTRPENLTLIPFQANQEKIWHRMFVQSITQNFQLQITFDDTQMLNEDINGSDFILHALTLYMTDNIRMIQ